MRPHLPTDPLFPLSRLWATDMGREQEAENQRRGMIGCPWLHWALSASPASLTEALGFLLCTCVLAGVHTSAAGDAGWIFWKDRPALLRFPVLSFWACTVSGLSCRCGQKEKYNLLGLVPYCPALPAQWLRLTHGHDFLLTLLGLLPGKPN